MDTNKTTHTRDFKGIWIPKEIWLATDLTTFEKLLLAEIDSLSTEDNCFASNEYFANFFDCQPNTITRGISKLKELGYVSEVGFDGRKRYLKSNLKVVVDKK